MTIFNLQKRVAFITGGNGGIGLGMAKGFASAGAIDRAEHARGSCCVAAPIFDANNRPIGAISVSGRDIEPLIKHHELVRHLSLIHI